MRKVLPFITCEIDQEELAERRAEMQALETPLPNDDKLAYVAYVCINHPDDLQQIVEALLPPLRRA